MNPADNFIVVLRDTGKVWQHKSEPVWIVCYEEIRAPNYIRPTFYQAYRSVKKPPPGRTPWSVDNRRLSPDGFATLEAAMAAAA